MDSVEYGILKAKFLKLYANIPYPLRTEIVALVGDETFSWAAAHAEVKHDGRNAKNILKQLIKLGLI
ncbi:MAG: hypothetical protein V1744_08145 [Candidatus Altiarchaeota archaeon]